MIQDLQTTLPTRAATLLRAGARGLVCVATLLALGTQPLLAAAPKAEPPVKISLADLGFQTLSEGFLRSGSSMLTVDFVDDQHLLVTFSVRRLMKRDAVIHEEDQDRVIGAYLLELPTGKLLAQTEWRVHDHGQYLWNLGRGRFLLRIRDQVSMIAPTHSTDPSQAFREYQFLNIDRRIAAILVSAENDLLTIETADPPVSAGPAPTGSGTGPAFAPPINPAPIQINFYRLAEDETGKKGLLVMAAGVLRTREPIALPVTAAGYLDVIEGSKSRWMFNFDTHGGKINELTSFDSGCFPRITFVSKSEFVAFGCHGGSEKQLVGGFNLRGEQMWQQNFFDAYAFPTFSFAPAAGRFALGRTILSSAANGGMANLGSMIQSQEVRVFQTDTGRLLLKVDCSPVERAGQNFALSGDGLRLAVVRETTEHHGATKYDEAHTERVAALEIYPLPALTAKEEVAVKEARGMAPKDGYEMIQLTTRTAPVAGVSPQAAAAAEAAQQPSPAAATAAPVVDATAPVAAPTGAQALDNLQIAGAETAAPQPTPAQADGAAAGDAEPDGPRKPPTLYGPSDPPSKPQ